MNRVLVFTSIERAFYSSVIEYQLFEPIVEVSKTSKNKFMYLGFIPITFWFTRHEPLKSFKLYSANRRRIKQFLVNHNIKCSFIPIIFPIRHKDFYLRIHWLILYLLNTLPLLLWFVLFHRINLIHARNYPAALLCFLICSFLGISYNFDMRDLYPEKGIEAGVFGKFIPRERRSYRLGWSYRLWKFIELNLLRVASSIIVTSIPFYEYVSSKLKTQNSKLKIVPNCVNPYRFKPDNKKRTELRAFYGISDKFVLIHSGAFGTPQDILVVGKYFLKWKEFIKHQKRAVHLVILCGTKKYLSHIRSVLESVGLTPEDYTLINPEPTEVPSLLLLGDVGLHLESLAIATPYCIAVKDGEYLASGLPIICTHWLKGIAGLIEKYNAGIVVDPNISSNDKELYLLRNYDKMREGGFKLVDELLSFEKCVRYLKQIYE